jgi:hypothetical protein
MQVIMKFNLPEDENALEAATKGEDLSLIIWELHQWLRENYKYNKGDITADDAYKVNDKLKEIMLSYGLTFDSKIFE